MSSSSPHRMSARASPRVSARYAARAAEHVESGADADGPAPAPTGPANAQAPATPKIPRAGKAILIAYAALYVAVFGVYFWQLSARNDPTDPVEWLDNAFPGWRSVRAADGQNAPDPEKLLALALAQRPADAPWNHIPPSDRVFAAPFAFTPVGAGASRTSFEAGQRMQTRQAAALAAALIRDIDAAARNAPPAPTTPGDGAVPEAGAASSPSGPPPLPLMKDGFWFGLSWPYWLNVLNLLGFWLLVGVFLGGFLLRFLDSERQKAADGLERAREAEAEAEALRAKNAELEAELESRRERFLELAEIEGKAERESILAAALREAEDHRAGLRQAVAADIEAARLRLTSEIGRAVVDRARELLAERVSDADNDAAVDAFIAEIESQPERGARP